MLAAGTLALERSACPCNGERDFARGAREDDVIAERDRYGLPLTSVLCSSCGTIRLDPYLTPPGLEYFYKSLYQQMYGRSADVDSYFARQAFYGTKILKTVQHDLPRGGVVFEVGCGAGGALKMFQDAGHIVAGCDYGGELVAAGRARGVPRIYHGSLEEAASVLGERKIDLLYLHHVFEHLNDPADFLIQCRRFLSARGSIVVIVPDMLGIDRHIVPAGDFLQFLHIAHKYNFTLKCLQRLGAQNDYEVLKLVPDHRLKTPWSVAPELWVQLRPFGEQPPSSSSSRRCVAATNDDAAADGAKVFAYLMRTEKKYALGLCRGQLKIKLARMRDRAASKRYLRRLALRRAHH